MIDYFQNGVASHINSFAWDTFIQQVFTAAFCVRQKHITGMINISTVNLFRNAIIITAITLLHMIDPVTQSFSDQNCEPAIRIPKDQEFIPLFGQYYTLDFGDYNTEVLSKRALCFQKYIW